MKQDQSFDTGVSDAQEMGANRSVKRLRRKSRSANNMQIYFGGVQ